MGPPADDPSNQRQEDFQHQAQELIATAWDELQIKPGSSQEDISMAYRQIALRHLMKSGKEDLQQAKGAGGQSTFYKQSLAYRYLSSIPISNRQFVPMDIIPTLRPLDYDNNQPEQDQEGGEILKNSSSNQTTDLRAFAMMDVSIGSLERAQKPFELPYVNYVINVHYCLRQHVVRRRYQEFQALHENLSTKIPVLPQLPQKSWHTKFKMDGLLARELALYLNRIIDLLAIRQVFSLDLMAFLEIDFLRIRKEEEGHAVKYLATLGGLSSSASEIGYIVNVPWLEQWKTFIEGKGPAPGPIRNTELFDKDEKLKSNLHPVEHYRSLNRQNWSYLKLIYRGGPELPRRSNNIYGPYAVDRVMATIIAQKLIRGFIIRTRYRRMRLKIERSDPKVQAKAQAMETMHQNQQIMKQIRSVLQSESKNSVEIAAVKIQQFYKRYTQRRDRHDVPVKIDHSSKGKKKLTLPSKTKKVKAEPKPITFDAWTPADCLSLLEIAQLEDSSERLAEFITALQAGMAMTKAPTRFKKEKLLILSMNASGSMLHWCGTGKTLTKSIPFKEIEDLQFESIASPSSKKTGNFFGLGNLTSPRADSKLELQDQEKDQGQHKCILTVHGLDKSISIMCESSVERRVLYEGLMAIIESCQARVQTGAYIDSYGIPRRMEIHSKKLIRDARKTTQEGSIIGSSDF